MRLLGDHIHAQPILPEYSGSVFIPESFRKAGHYMLWQVLAVGPGKLNRKGILLPVECQAGDRIVTYSNMDGTDELGDGTAIIESAQVLAVLS